MKSRILFGHISASNESFLRHFFFSRNIESLRLILEIRERKREREIGRERERDREREKVRDRKR